MTSTEQNTCGFFVARKKRYCKMVVKKGKKFCGEHAAEENKNDNDCDSDRSRMPCPYDPKHSCYISQLEKHLARCNSKPKPVPDYIRNNINVPNQALEDVEIKVQLSSISDDNLLAFIEKITKLYKDRIGCLSSVVGQHVLVEPMLSGLKQSRGSWRHLYQSSSILFNMEQAQLLNSEDSKLCYVEFGSGRGQLSYLLAQIINLQNGAIVLIDKSSPRHKHENRFREEESFNTAITRIRADIADIDLSCIAQSKDRNHVIGIGKHLCGAGTDLALECLHNATSQERKGDTAPVVKGVCIALCCHHQCTWQHYVGKQFFSDNDLTKEDFAVMKALTSWATCGSRNQDNLNKSLRQQHEPVENEVNVSRYGKIGLDIDKREEIGRQCKQIIDYGRVDYLSKWQVSPLKAKLVYYVEKEISLENVLLIATS